MSSQDIGDSVPITLRNLPKYELDVKMQEILIPSNVLFDRIAEMGEQISNDYRGGEPPLLVSILKGGVVFLTDLMRWISIPHHIDFMQLSSYQGGTSSTGNVRLLSDLSTNIRDRDVLLVEDIVDTGLTITYLLKQLAIRKPKSVRVCTLLSKTEAPYCKYRWPLIAKQVNCAGTLEEWVSAARYVDDV